MHEDMGSRGGEEAEILCVRLYEMTEVWEEKLKLRSDDVEGKANQTSSMENEAKKETAEKKSDDNDITCHQCGRVFKNHRALTTHERYCKTGRVDKRGKGAQETKKRGQRAERIENEKDINTLREELMTDMAAIKEERRRLHDEREAFRE
jgi:hypothetical protein